MIPRLSGSRRIVLFDRLTPLRAEMARIFARLGLRVLYLDPVGSLRRPERMAELEAGGVHHIRVADLAGFDAFAADKLLAQWSELALDALLPGRTLDKVAATFPLVADRRRKVQALVHHVIMTGLQPQKLTYSICSYLEQRGEHCVLWSAGDPFAALVFRKFVPLPVIVPSLMVAALGIVTRVVAAIRGKLNRSAAVSVPTVAATFAPECTQSEPNCSEAPVLLFPHQGLTYGKLFERNQYYSTNSASAFARHRICHIELTDALPAGEGAAHVINGYRAAGITPCLLNVRPSPNSLKAWLATMLIGRRQGLGFFASVVVEIARRRVVRGLAALEAFPRAHVALLGYEFLFPIGLAYALQARGVRVVATQERFFHYLLPGWTIVIDDYFVQGEAARERLTKNKYACIGHIHVVGDVRSDWLTRGVRRHAGFPSGYDHATLVLDWDSTPDPVLGAELYTNSWANNKLFYRDVFDLARRYPRNFFLIRGKDTNWLNIPEFEAERAEMAALTNVAVNSDYSRLGIAYELAEAADSIIARFTSLGDQSLAAGKPVVYHDISANGGLLISSLLGAHPAFATTRETFISLYERVLTSGDVMSATERSDMMHYYFARPPATGSIKDEVLRTLEGFLADRVADRVERETALGEAAGR
jgi:hypothetical protein